MCRLQFSSPVPREGHVPGGDQEALEALLALSADTGIDYDMIKTPAQSSIAQLSSSRYHCPFPGCKRSFAELWRLKVHYRAPPNIRGSGKERGHGMRLTHCPKCGAALKVGGHHVKCAAVSKEPASNTVRRNRKAAAGAPRAAQPPPPPALASAACMEAVQFEGQHGSCTGPAGQDSTGSRRIHYQQYGLSDIMQQETVAGGGMLWQKALELHTQQQQQRRVEESYDGAGAPSYSVKPGYAGAPTVAGGSAPDLHRVPSSDDSSSSRAVEATTSGADNFLSGHSSSSGSGAGPDDADAQQQQQQQVSLYGGAAARTDPSLAIKQEAEAAQPTQPEQRQHHPEAGRLLWQHMLLQHLQQHVQHTPGFSLPELIQVAAALFGNRVDTLVNAFGLAGDSAAGQAPQEQEQLAQLVALLRQTDSTPAVAVHGAAAAAAAGYAQQ